MADERYHKPGKIFTVLLFLYFYSITISWLALLSQGHAWGMDSLTNSPVPYSKIVYAIFILLFLLHAYRTIIGALQLAPWSVRSLRISIVLFFLLLIQSPLHNQGALNMFWTLGILVLLFILLLYSFLSRDLKTRIPSRRLGGLGWTGIALVLSAFIPMVWYVIDQTVTMAKSQPISPERLLLDEGEVSDGLFIFRLNQGWKIDSIAEIADGRRMLVLSDTTLIISTVIDEIRSGATSERMAFHNIIADAIKDNCADDIRQKETYFQDTVINGNPLCMSFYELSRDSSLINLRCAALFSRDYDKFLFLAQPTKGAEEAISKEEILRLMETVTFDTRKRLTKEQTIDDVAKGKGNEQ